MKVKAICFGGVLAMAGCQIGDSDTDKMTDPSQATLSGEACPDVGSKAYFFWMSPISAEPGQQIGLTPYWTDMPGGYNRLPSECLDDLQAHPEDAVIFTRTEYGVPVAEIAADAAAGTRVHVSATYNGHGLVGLVDVYRAENNPLVGVWRQDGAGCASGSAVQELVFTGSGEFSVTWTPFESYKDYWGEYVYEAETGHISLDVKSGNQVPDDVSPEGGATVSGDVLSFEGVSLGTPRSASAACQGNFSKSS